MTASAFIAKNYRNSVRTLEQELDEFITEIELYDDDKLGIVKRSTTKSFNSPLDSPKGGIKKMTTM